MDEFAEVLAHYPRAIRTLNWARLADSGGLSGAVILRGDLDSEPLFCAKRYPASTSSDDILRQHRWLADASGLGFVPRLMQTETGETLVASLRHNWEVHDWMPGRADFAADPSPVKLLAACDAVLSLHSVWRNFGTRLEPSRAIRNRLMMIAKWRTAPPPIRTPLEARAAAAISRHLDRAESRLVEWVDRPHPCHPCVRDLRRDHFLFEGDKLTGLIDYGAADWDTPATDAARMLGELAGEDRELYEVGIDRFAGLRDLIRLMDLAGTVGSVIRWLYRLSEPMSIPVGPPIARGRLAMLTERLESSFFDGCDLAGVGTRRLGPTETT